MQLIKILEMISVLNDLGISQVAIDDINEDFSFVEEYYKRFI